MVLKVYTSCLGLWNWNCLTRQERFWSEEKVTQSCLTPCDPMDCSPPGSVQEILQARILEWVVISFSRGSSELRDWTLVSCTAGRFFTHWATKEDPKRDPIVALILLKSWFQKVLIPLSLQGLPCSLLLSMVFEEKVHVTYLFCITVYLNVADTRDMITNNSRLKIMERACLTEPQLRSSNC